MHPICFSDLYQLSMMAILCPQPLISFDITTAEASLCQGCEIHAVGSSNCAVPCPTLLYDDAQWNGLADTVLYTSGIACVLSFAVFCAHVCEFRRYYIRLMFISGFVVNSLVMFVFQLLLASSESSPVCHSDYEYIPRGAMCMAQAVISIWMLLWAHTWSVIMSYDTYLHVMLVYRHEDKTRLQVIYTIIGFLVPTVLTAFPLVYETIGFDYQANIPICLYLVSTFNWVFWISFVIPFYLLLTITLGFTFATSVRIHEVFISSGHYQIDGALLNGNLNSTNRKGSSNSLLITHGTRQNSSTINNNNNNNKLNTMNNSPVFLSAVSESYYRSEATSDPSERNSFIRAYNPVNVDSTFEDDDDINQHLLSPQAQQQARQEQQVLTSDGLCSSVDDTQSMPSTNSMSADPRNAGSNTELDISRSNSTNNRPEGEQPQGITKSKSLISSSQSGENTPARSDPSIPIATIYALKNNSNKNLEQGRRHSNGGLAMNDNRSSESWSSDMTGQETMSLGAHLASCITCCLNAMVMVLTLGYFGSVEEIVTHPRYLLLSAIWHYNGRAIVFVVVCGLTTFAMLPMTMKQFYFEFDNEIDSANNFVVCLVNASRHCDEQTQEGVNKCGQEACSDHPTRMPNYYMVRDNVLYLSLFTNELTRSQITAIMIWTAGYGIAPSLIFGFLGYLTQYYNSLKKVLSWLLLCGNE
jgi:hypothetical protein